MIDDAVVIDDERHDSRGTILSGKRQQGETGDHVPSGHVVIRSTFCSFSLPLQDQLAAALEKQTWDPSVKSLVPFPQVLQMMSDKLDWTQRLGDAVPAQQKDVMDSVQRLRRQAQDAGTLNSNEQQKVVTERLRENSIPPQG